MFYNFKDSLFTFQDYFRNFNQISINDSLILDAIYVDFHIASFSVIYIYAKSDNPDSVMKLLPNTDNKNSIYRNYFDDLIVEDSEMGYFHLIVFRLIGDNFLLGWHAGYGEREIICSQIELSRIINRLRPNKIKLYKRDTLVYYNCGIMF